MGLLARDQNWTHGEMGQRIETIERNWKSPLVGTDACSKEAFCNQAREWARKMTTEERATFVREWDLRTGLSAIAFAHLVVEIAPDMADRK